MIRPERTRILCSAPGSNGEYVIYWMQAAQRPEYNHALEYATEHANKLGKPLVVLFCLVCDYPEANERHYYFMLEGLRETQNSLEARGVRMVIVQEAPELAVPRLAERAALVVVDGGHLRIQRKWRDKIAARIDCPLIEVETNLIVPVEAASAKEDYSAGTFRPKISRQLDRYLVKLRHRKPRVDSLKLSFDSLPIRDIDQVIAKLGVDHSVGKVERFRGGLSEAKRHLRAFLKDKLDHYADQHSDPNVDCVSSMSPYLHFGQISPLFVALEVSKTSSPGGDAYIEQLIVRRELSYNFVYYNSSYDSFKSLPAWVMRTLNYHRRDKRQYIYSPEQLEAGRTHDVYWNAAQEEMVLTGISTAQLW